jgi:hypothetical protein
LHHLSPGNWRSGGRDASSAVPTRRTDFQDWVAVKRYRPHSPIAAPLGSAETEKSIPLTILWRLHIRPGGGDGDTAASVALCLQRSIVGMGWAVPEEDTTRSTDLDWYKKAAARQYKDSSSRHSVWTFAEQPEVGDLVWFRNEVRWRSTLKVL